MDVRRGLLRQCQRTGNQIGINHRSVLFINRCNRFAKLCPIHIRIDRHARIQQFFLNLRFALDQELALSCTACVAAC